MGRLSPLSSPRFASTALALRSMWLPYVKNDAINSAVETLTTLSTEPWDNPSCNDAPGCGTVFQLTSSGTLTVLYSFSNGTDGGDPFAGLIADEAGNLYGTTWDGGDSGRGTVFQLDPSGTLTVLHSFTGGSDGQRPVTGLIADAAGNLYGTAHSGGDGYGTVFQLDPSGTLTALYSFTGGSDGRYPDSGLIADAAGNLYGTTREGGDLVSCNTPNTHGCGTVFQLTPSGDLTVLHRFAGSDGSRPVDGLLADAAGNLYGTTSAGGDRTSCAPQFIEGCGTVFQLTPSGALTVLYSFTGGTDGGDPTAGVIADAAGNLYGTTLEGGATASCNRPYGCG